jgi:hypothetical protein
VSQDSWAFVRDRLTDLGLARLQEDYDKRAEMMPERSGEASRIGREDFACGWMSLAQRLGGKVYLR